MQNTTGPAIAHLTARDRFDRERRRAAWHHALRFAGFEQAELLSFGEVRRSLRLANEQYAGIQEVPVEQIVGSVGRTKDFTRDFRPRRKNLRDRWERLAVEMEWGAGLPPVELYRVGGVYFVRDGHHRVSICRIRDAATIQAQVWEFRTPVALTRDLTSADLPVKRAYLDFLEHTRLASLRSDVQLDAGSPAGYRELAEHVDVHRYFLGVQEQRDVSIEEATASWYDNVFVPVVRAIHDNGLDAVFPVRTDAERYLWVVRHWHYLKQRYGELHPGIAAEHLAQLYPRTRLGRFVRHVSTRLYDCLHRANLNELPGHLRDKI